ncbi:MAG: hypothetical protein H6970_16220 [Gammaproteobacteria bacterium]|nr:hypothetical protein [Gammaproteobacteria bacterium]MCP5459300.1 hypothetical protein [Gammaproteobacteria bacterium]
MPAVVTREMGLTHAEFFRTLPSALEGLHFRIGDAAVDVCDSERRLTIRLAPEGQRRLAALRLPVTQVTFLFDGYSETEQATFLRHFERRFQRGGG